LTENDEFKNYAKPCKVSDITFSRYTAGMRYGDHIDEPVNWSPRGPLRSDLSFTIFLSPPGEYEGGELIAKVLDDEVSVKYGAGDMVIYPSGLMHRVNEVTGGCRRVALGWVQSMVPRHDYREILHAIERVRNKVLATSGRNEDYNALSFAHANLMRLWSEV
jgi:PKHD-type hydroxylase